MPLNTKSPLTALNSAMLFSEMLAKLMVCVFAELFSIFGVLPLLVRPMELPEMVNDAAPLLKTSPLKFNQSVMLLVTLPLPELPKTKRPLALAHQSLEFHVEALLDQFFDELTLFQVCCARASRGNAMRRNAVMTARSDGRRRRRNEPSRPSTAQTRWSKDGGQHADCGGMLGQSWGGDFKGTN